MLSVAGILVAAVCLCSASSAIGLSVATVVDGPQQMLLGMCKDGAGDHCCKFCMMQSCIPVSQNVCSYKTTVSVFGLKLLALCDQSITQHRAAELECHSYQGTVWHVLVYR